MKTDHVRPFYNMGVEREASALVPGSTLRRSRSNSFLIDRALRLGPRQWCAGGLR